MKYKMRYEHGRSVTYTKGCRCDLCRAAAVEKRAVLRKARYAERIMVDGRWFAPRVAANAHGTLATYGNWGCRCEPCTKAASVEGRERHAKQSKRLVNSSPPADLKHGTAGAYRYWRCRCRVCKSGNQERNRRMRERVFDKRVEIDGRMVVPGGPHGVLTTYSTKGCRCEACSKAGYKYHKELPLRKARQLLAEKRELGEEPTL